MKKIIIFLCLCTLSGWLQAQQTWEIQGRIVDANKGEAIPFVTVFVANTSLGTSSNLKGEFRLSLPEPHVEMVFSAVGYESFVLPLNADMFRGKELRVSLKEKVTMLKEAVITANNAQWRAQYQSFLRYFLSTTPNASACQILNPEVLDFDQEGLVFKASASDLIIIENKALGYRIKYKLERFEVDYDNRYFVVSGYPLFEAMSGNERQQKLWEKARLETYKGSTLHLMRSIYQRNWPKEGFELRRVIQKPNEDRPPEALIKEKIAQFSPGKPAHLGKNDSLNYWIRQKAKPEYIQTVINTLLSPDSIVQLVPEQSSQVSLIFENNIHVLYKEPPAKGYFGGGDKNKQESVLHLKKPQVAIREDGRLVESLDIVYEGYLAWPKIANMLPLGYQPPKK